MSYLSRPRYCLLCAGAVSSASLLRLLSDCLSAAYRSFLRLRARRSFSPSSSSPPLATASGSEPSGCSPHFQLPHMSAYFELSYLLSLLIRAEASCKHRVHKIQDLLPQKRKKLLNENLLSMCTTLLYDLHRKDTDS